MVMHLLTRTLILLLALAITLPAVAQNPTEDDYYPIQTLPIPEGVVLEVGGIAQLPDKKLAVSSRRRGHSRLMECLTNTECAFELENKSVLVHPMVTYLQERATHLGVCDDSDATRIGVA